jgi:hypothetical protein
MRNGRNGRKEERNFQKRGGGEIKKKNNQAAMTPPMGNLRISSDGRSTGGCPESQSGPTKRVPLGRFRFRQSGDLIQSAIRVDVMGDSGSSRGSRKEKRAE